MTLMAEVTTPVEIPRRALFKAAEVCELMHVQPYVLRTWEAEFPALGFSKAGGPRVYRRADVEQVARIKHLLLVDGLTLAGARRRLEEEAAPVAVDAPSIDELIGQNARERLTEVKRGLRSILELLRAPWRPPGAAAVCTAAGCREPDYRGRPRKIGGAWQGVGAQHEFGAPKAFSIRSSQRRDVAQPGSALDWGSRGRGFESRHPDQFSSGGQPWVTQEAGSHPYKGLGLRAPGRLPRGATESASESDEGPTPSTSGNVLPLLRTPRTRLGRREFRETLWNQRSLMK